eukprot:1643326-Pleurochrysis_carterae.AAC.1
MLRSDTLCPVQVADVRARRSRRSRVSTPRLEGWSFRTLPLSSPTLSTRALPTPTGTRLRTQSWMLAAAVLAASAESSARQANERLSAYIRFAAASTSASCPEGVCQMRVYCRSTGEL